MALEALGRRGPNKVHMISAKFSFRSVLVCVAVWLIAFTVPFIAGWRIVNLSNLRLISMHGKPVVGVVTQVDFANHNSFLVQSVVNGKPFSVWGTASNNSRIHLQSNQRVIVVPSNPELAYVGDPGIAFRTNIKLLSIVSAVFATLVFSGFKYVKYHLITDN